MTLDEMPKPHDIMDRPQVAIIVALETTLVAALRSLLAAHPEIYNGEFPRTLHQRDFWADRLIYLGSQLQSALRKYQDTLEEEDIDSDNDHGDF